MEKYLVIKMYKEDKKSFIVEPNKPLTFDEAQALRNLHNRTAESFVTYVIVELCI